MLDKTNAWASGAPRVLSDHIGDTVPERILLDCDGVLLGWWEGYSEFFERKFGRRLSEAGPDTFNMVNWTGIADKDERMRLVAEFNSPASPEFGLLKPRMHAVEAVAAMRSLGIDLVVITSCSNDPALVRMRQENLAKVFGADSFSDVICLSMEETKTATLAKFTPSIWIDDNEGNVRAGLETGHTGMLMKDSHNLPSADALSREGVGVIESWIDFKSAMEESWTGPRIPQAMRCS